MLTSLNCIAGDALSLAATWPGKITNNRTLSSRRPADGRCARHVEVPLVLSALRRQCSDKSDDIIDIVAVG